MNNHLKRILEFRSNMKSKENEILKNKLKKLNLHIFVTSFATEYFLADKDKNIVETISEKVAEQIFHAKENETAIKAVLKKCCDQINNAKTAFALESISCADLNLESVSA